MQGFGNVGSAAAELFAQAGARIVAAQDHTGTILNARGFDMADLMAHMRRHEGVAGFEGAEAIDEESFWDVNCDVLIPAALEGQLTAARARRVRSRLVLEGANGPTLPEADDILAERAISVFWSEDEINLRLDKIVVDALKHIWHTADRHNVTLRTAAFIVACERILIAREERGLYP